MAGNTVIRVAVGEIGNQLPSEKGGDAQVNDCCQDNEFTEFQEPRHCRVHEFEPEQQGRYQTYVGEPGWELATEETGISCKTRKKQWRYVTFRPAVETEVDDEQRPCNLERRCQVELVRPRHSMTKFLKRPEHAGEARIGSIVPGVVKLFVIAVILEAGIPSNLG